MLSHEWRRRFAASWLSLAIACALSGCGNQQKTADAAPPAESSSATPSNDKPAKSQPAAAEKSLLDAPAPEDELQPYAAGSTPETVRTGEDWPRFLGLRETGVSGETGLLREWPEDGPRILWQKQIGTGYTAPSVKGGRLVLHHRVRDEEVVQCCAADTGEPLWRHAYPTAFEDPYGYNNGPRCSPLLTKDRCYTFGAEGVLLCLDLKTGREIWKVDTQVDFRVPEAFFGVGATPILEGNRLIVMVGGAPDAGMVAFDARDGKVVWHNVGLKNWEPTFRYQPDQKLASYSTPLAATIHGKRQILAFMRPGLIALDPQSGEPLYNLFFRATFRESVNAARPVVVGDQIFLSAAYDVGATVLKVHEDCKGFDTVWRDEFAMQNHWSTSIHHEGYLYGFSGRHEPGSSFRCIELASGKVKWQTHEPGEEEDPDPRAGLQRTPPKYYGRGSAIMADGRFIVLGERGLLALVEVNPDEFREISRIKYRQMKYPSWAAPVLSRGRLYLRCEEHLMCLDLAAPQRGAASTGK
ncbi:MAG TPA: PQQ-binding-like beta-propeller repeat protein [Planctomycetaceae bacterium]|nr:PQQ-binding-like beta-propeller repeat protein [Planctomycetaceae bacterium]